MNEYHAIGVRSTGSGCRSGMLPPAPSGMRWYTGPLKNKTTQKMGTLKKKSLKYQEAIGGNIAYDDVNL